MTIVRVEISCPHCRREYAIDVDVDRLARFRTRAVCARCNKSFDVASRLRARASGSMSAARANPTEEHAEAAQPRPGELSGAKDLQRRPRPTPISISRSVPAPPSLRPAVEESGPAVTAPPHRDDSRVEDLGPSAPPVASSPPLDEAPTLEVSLDEIADAPSPPPPTWLELADPGLLGLRVADDPAAAILRELLEDV